LRVVHGIQAGLFSLFFYFVHQSFLVHVLTLLSCFYKSIKLRSLPHNILRDPNLALRQLALMFEVPKSTLHKGISQHSTRAKAARQTQKLLSISEEEAPSAWIKKWDDHGFGTCCSHVYQIVESLVRALNSRNQVGKHWRIGFLGRHPDLDAKVGRCLDKKRALATDLDSFKMHLDRIDHIWCKFYVKDEDTWNMDEKGFAIELGGAGTIVCHASRRNPSIIQDGGCDWVTIVEAISGGAKCLRPLIIFKANAYLMGHHTSIEIEEKQDAFFATFPKGYTNSDITFQWFQEVFDPRTWPMNRINQHRILVWDGHSTHVENYKFIKYVMTTIFIFYVFPPIRLMFSNPSMLASSAQLQPITSKSWKIVYVCKALMVQLRREKSFPWFREQGRRPFSQRQSGQPGVPVG